MCLNRKKTGKFFVGITYKKRRFIIHQKYLDAKNMFSHPFIHNLKPKPNMVQYLSRKIRYNLIIDIGEQCQTANPPKNTHHWEE